jgi:EcoRII C terminal
MEKCVKWILGRCTIPNEEAAAISGQSDLVVPSAAVLKKRPERAIVLEFKRTIRERWKEVRDEIARTGLKVWLLTLDDYISHELVRLMARGNTTLYVPEAVYRKLRKRNSHLRSLKSLVSDLEAFVS